MLKKLLLVTDAYAPQINGVVRTLQKLEEYSTEMGFETFVLSPDAFRQLPNPFYPEIRLALPNKAIIEEIIARENPTHIHIATEGPIGFMVRKWCKKNKKKFTTSYHTKFPEFMWKQFHIPAFTTRWFFKWFHNGGSGVFGATLSLQQDMKRQGFKRVIPWTRGVDLEMYQPMIKHNKLPKFLYVGRVSKEKNIEAFLNLSIPGDKIVVGGGPELPSLKNRFPDVTFMGVLTGKLLAEQYAKADVFVFPSKVDTFGIVLLEAMASGLPVAAYPVTGPIDVVTEKTGSLNNNLQTACLACLKLDPTDCVNEAKKYSWEHAARIFFTELVPV
jgi:glycosyltransferase involved in cell wall biosynthesis